MSEKLKSCPFCGGVAELNEWEHGNAPKWCARVECEQCGAKGPTKYADNRLGRFNAENGEHRNAAIAAWNTRAPASEPSEAMDFGPGFGPAVVARTVANAIERGEHDTATKPDNAGLVEQIERLLVTENDRWARGYNRAVRDCLAALKDHDHADR